MVGPLRGTDGWPALLPPQHKGLGPTGQLLLASGSRPVSSGIHLHGLCGFQVLWLWLTSLDQDVGALGPGLVAAQSLGHMEPGGKHR